MLIVVWKIAYRMSLARYLSFIHLHRGINIRSIGDYRSQCGRIFVGTLEEYLTLVHFNSRWNIYSQARKSYFEEELSGLLCAKERGWHLLPFFPTILMHSLMPSPAFNQNTQLKPTQQSAHSWTILLPRTLGPASLSQILIILHQIANRLTARSVPSWFVDEKQRGMQWNKDNSSQLGD